MRSTTYSLTFVAECALSNVHVTGDVAHAYWWSAYATRHFGRKAGVKIADMIRDAFMISQARENFRRFELDVELAKALGQARRERSTQTCPSRSEGCAISTFANVR